MFQAYTSTTEDHPVMTEQGKTALENLITDPTKETLTQALSDESLKAHMTGYQAFRCVSYPILLCFKSVNLK